MTLETNSHRFLSEAVNNYTDLAEILEHVEQYCQNCETISPMKCVERCEIWEIKNEFLEMNEILIKDSQMSNLFNIVKNKRRLRIMEALSERPRGIKGLQEYLKDNGYYHSRRTIVNEYLKPLIRAGLVREDGGKYKSTLFGQKFHQLINRHNSEILLPSHSRCYEESVLRHLSDGPKSYENLAGTVAQKSLARAIKRLRERGLITNSQSSDYVFYFKTRKEPNVAFSPTERRIYEAIPGVGISARKLSEEVGITLRRTYKYLRRLRRKRLVFARERPKTYELTPSGKKIADFIEEMTNFVLTASKVSASILQHSRQVDPQS